MESLDGRCRCLGQPRPGAGPGGAGAASTVSAEGAGAPSGCRADAGAVSAKDYSALLSELRRKQDWRSCLATITHMHEHEQTKLTNSHVTVAIGACGTASQWRPAVNLVRTLSNSSALPPDLISLNAAIKCCSAAGALVEADELLHVDIPRAGLTPDGYSFVPLLHACSKAGDADGAMKLLDEMRDHSAGADAFVYASVLSALRRAGRPLRRGRHRHPTAGS